VNRHKFTLDLTGGQSQKLVIIITKPL